MPILAYGSVPHASGTFTFYRNLRRELAPLGWDVRCLAVGAADAALWDSAFADEGCVQLASDQDQPREMSRAFVAWAQREGVRAVMPMNSVALLSAMPHLPQGLSAVTRVPNTSDYGYAVATAYPDRTARVVATTPRHVADLQARAPALFDRVRLVPHGIEPSAFAGRPVAQPGESLRLAYLGRFDHRFKGTLFLPPILEALANRGVDVRLSIAGGGGEENALRAALAPFDSGVRFVGTIPPKDVPGFLHEADVLLFPSQSEGFGFSLIQAAMAGTVPVASRLPGVTDFTVRDGETGVLCPVGDVGCFADAVARLDADRDWLAQLSAAAAADAADRFSADRMAEAYVSVFEEVETSWTDPPPLPWSAFRMHPAVRPTWRTRIPRPVRVLARNVLDRLRPAAQP